MEELKYIRSEILKISQICFFYPNQLGLTDPFTVFFVFCIAETDLIRTVGKLDLVHF